MIVLCIKSSCYIDLWFELLYNLVVQFPHSYTTRGKFGNTKPISRSIWHYWVIFVQFNFIRVNRINAFNRINDVTITAFVARKYYFIRINQKSSRIFSVLVSSGDFQQLLVICFYSEWVLFVFGGFICSRAQLNS